MRADASEIMDDPAVDPVELERAFRFIRFVNRSMGGIAVVLERMERLLVARANRGGMSDRIRVLDLGTGCADIPIAIVSWARRRGLALEVVAVDNHPGVIEIARRATERHPSITVLELDAATVADTLAPGSFDLVHAGMFLHHLDEIEVLTVLRVMERMSRQELLWSDLHRDVLSKLGVRLLTFGQPRVVRHDAVLSVSKGFTTAEAAALAERVGLRDVRVSLHRRWGRFTLLARGEGPPARSNALDATPD